MITQPRLTRVRGLIASASIPFLGVGCEISPDARYECSDCEVVVERIVTLGARGDDGLWGYPSAVVRAGEDRFFVQAELEGPAPFVFSDRGNLIGRETAHGASVTLVASAVGAPALAEYRHTSRARLHDPATGSVVEIPSRARPYQGLRRSDGSYVFGRQAAAGEPTLLALTSDGTVAREFGPRMPGPDDDALGLSAALAEKYGPGFAEWLAEGTTIRVLAEAGDGGLWAAANRHAYRLERWNEDGDLTRLIEPRVDWFPTRHPGEAVGARGVPQPAVLGLWEDARGLVWIVGQTPDPSWDAGSHSNAELNDAHEKQYDRMYDVVIEAIDPTSGEIVHHRRLTEATGFPHVVEPGMIAVPRRALGGHWQVDLLRVDPRTD